GLKMLAEALEQPVDQSGLRQRLTKQPDCGSIRHRVRELQIEKAHERQPVTDQVLGLLGREIGERLQHHDLELQDRIIGLAAGIALALLGLRLRHRLDVSAEILPSHDFLDRLQRIALGTDRLQSALNIEKTSLPHDPLAPSAHYRVRSPSQIRGELARGIFRGAQYDYQRYPTSFGHAGGLARAVPAFSKPKFDCARISDFALEFDRCNTATRLLREFS